MKYQFIKENQVDFDINLLCNSLEVSRSGYYAWFNRKLSKRALENQHLEKIITKSFEESRQTYGHRRVHQVLKYQNEACGKHRVARIMKKQALFPRSRKKFKATTNSRHKLPTYPNYLQRNFSPKAPNQSWASDISVPQQAA